MNLGRIRQIPTPAGLQSLLIYWHRGKRARIVLGYNLTAGQAKQAAQKIIDAIWIREPKPSQPDATPNGDTTFAQYASTYLQYVKVKRHDSDGRNKAALENHLIPHFGSQRLGDLRLEDGMAYIERRRAENAAEGTIERECAVLMAVLNLAVDTDVLDKNRLRRLPIPHYIKRERVLQAWELQKLMKAASLDVRRLMMLALQTGLRVNKLIEIHQEWLVKRGNGWWLVPSPGKTKIKGVPKAIPLNGLALEALQVGDASRIAGRPFERWKDANSLKHRWQTTCKRAGVHDLHFHDLRHTAGTWLNQAGVDYVVIEKLLGHRLPGMGELYLHDWDGRLRDAVTRLETFTKTLLAQKLGNEVAVEVADKQKVGRPSARKMVPRDRIELSTPAFSGLCSAN